MAFNLKTFQTRTLTAIVFAAVMLLGLLWNHLSFLVLFSIIHFGCWWEYLKLVEKIQQARFHIYTKLGFMLAGYGLMTLFCGIVYSISGYGISENFSLVFSLAGLVLLIIGIFQKEKISLKSFATAALGMVYISLSWGLFLSLINTIDIYSKIDITIKEFYPVHLFSIAIPFSIIISIWINDTLAYIVGSLIGKTPLSKISPKKTWEGTIGGILLSIVVVGLLFSNFSFDLYMPGFVFSYENEIWYIIPAIASISGTLGDLLESKLKRMAGVKDSGSIMPGHGGFLDRFDSMLLAIPAVWLYVVLFV